MASQTPGAVKVNTELDLLYLPSASSLATDSTGKVIAGSGGSDTPWTVDHDAGNFSLGNLNHLVVGDVLANWDGTSSFQNNGTLTTSKLRGNNALQATQDWLQLEAGPGFQGNFFIDNVAASGAIIFGYGGQQLATGTGPFQFYDNGSSAQLLMAIHSGGNPYDPAYDGSFSDVMFTYQGQSNVTFGSGGANNRLGMIEVSSGSFANAIYATGSVIQNAPTIIFSVDPLQGTPSPDITGTYSVTTPANGYPCYTNGIYYIYFSTGFGGYVLGDDTIDTNIEAYSSLGGASGSYYPYGATAGGLAAYSGVNVLQSSLLVGLDAIAWNGVSNIQTSGGAQIGNLVLNADGSIGQYATAYDASTCITMGGSSHTGSQYCTAIGLAANSTGFASMCIGTGSQATGFRSLAIGPNSYTQYSNSFVVAASEDFSGSFDGCNDSDAPGGLTLGGGNPGFNGTPGYALKENWFCILPDTTTRNAQKCFLPNAGKFTDSTSNHYTSFDPNNRTLNDASGTEVFAWDSYSHGSGAPTLTGSKQLYRDDSTGILYIL